MSKHANLFKQVGNSKDMAGFLPSLPAGDHIVAMTKYGCKESKKDSSVFIEAEFIVLETNNPKVSVGDKHSCPWFINQSGFPGQYAQDRAKKFLKCTQKAIGNDADTGEFADSLSEDFESDAPEMYGIRYLAEVRQVFMPDGSPRKGAKDNDVFNTDWSADDQDEAAIAATREEIISLSGKPKAFRAPVKESAPAKESASTQETSAESAPAAKKLGLKGLMGKK